MIEPEIHIHSERLDYDGSQLAPHWIMRTFGITGDAIVAFIGGADVKSEAMVDLEDATAGLHIAADSMLHVIYETFGTPLELGVALQRLLVVLAAEQLNRMGVAVERRGDDLFVGDGKLSVSIATVSLTSSLVHFGINVSTDGTPIKTACLGDLGCDPRVFAANLLSAFAAEVSGMTKAVAKVRGVF